MRVLAIFSAAFSLAVLTAVYGGLYRFLLPVGLVFGLSAILAGFLLRRGKKHAQRLAVLVLVGAALGCLWTWGYDQIFVSPARALDGQTVYLSGRVKDWPEEGNWGWSVPVSVETETGVTVDTLLYLDEQGAGLQPGDRISSVVHCRFADRTYSGEEITYYTAKGIFLRGEAHGVLKVERSGGVPWHAVPAHLARMLEERILAAFPDGTGEAVMAIVTGNRDNLTQSYTTSLQRSGLSHTAAVSGMHLTFLAGFLASLLGPHRRRTSIVMLPVIVVFVMMAGCTPSVVRAAVMILMMMAAPFFSRERDDATALGAALLVLLLHNPLSVAHVGLQLSFAAVAGIFLIANHISSFFRLRYHLWGWEPWTGKWLLCLLPNYIVFTLSATLGASVLTVPLCAIHFSSVSLLSPVSNILTLWAVSLVFCGGLLVGVLGLVSPAAARLLALPVTWIANYMEWAMKGVSGLPFASVTLDSFSYKIWTILVSFAILFLLTKPGRRSAIAVGSLAVMTLAAAVLFAGLEFYAGPMSVTALDVGQGQSILLRQGRYLTLVDCGGNSYDNAGDLAANHIQNVGRRSLDLLVLTHFHDDHANGVPQLMERLQVKSMILPDVEEDAPLRREILALAERQGTEVLLLGADKTIDLGGGYRLNLFAPLGSARENEQGLSLLASWEETDVLITGDMSGETEGRLVRHAQLPHTEILVAGHHGSKYATSRALLQAIEPELVLISVSKDNNYGHPAPETLERLMGTEVHRTDLEGNITLSVLRRGA